MPDSAFQLAGRQLFRADRNRLSGKARGGGLCVYINKEDEKRRNWPMNTERLQTAHPGQIFISEDFQVSYQPGSKMLGQMPCPGKGNLQAPILHQSHITTPQLLVPLHWGTEDSIQRALQQEPGSGGGPRGWRYVPMVTRQQVIHLEHASPFSLGPWSSFRCGFGGLGWRSISFTSCKVDLLLQHMARVHWMSTDV
ncbi:hypothetical protein SRHO_G00141330 [Serrasalmus rhombeus]